MFFNWDCCKLKPEDETIQSFLDVCRKGSIVLIKLYLQSTQFSSDIKNLGLNEAIAAGCANEVIKLLEEYGADNSNTESIKRARTKYLKV